jgi:hypothetical protein
MQPVVHRLITPDETAVLRQALVRGAIAPVSKSILDTLASLTVVGTCSCGCRSIYFMAESREDVRVADTCGTTREGEPIDVMVWVRSGELAALDLVDYLSTGKLPDPASIGEPRA